MEMFSLPRVRALGAPQRQSALDRYISSNHIAHILLGYNDVESIYRGEEYIASGSTMHGAYHQQTHQGRCPRTRVRC
jgi:hypothetical protein